MSGFDITAEVLAPTSWGSVEGAILYKISAREWSKVTTDRMNAIHTIEQSTDLTVDQAIWIVDGAARRAERKYQAEAARLWSEQRKKGKS